MDISITGQGLEFLSSALLGAGLGIFYDFCRIVRSRVRFFIVTALFDILFWAVCAMAAFWFAMGIGGGELRIFAIFGMVGGAAVYFWLLSPIVRAVGFFLLDGFSTLSAIIMTPVGIFGRYLLMLAVRIRNVLNLLERKNRIKGVRFDIARANKLRGKAEAGEDFFSEKKTQNEAGYQNSDTGLYSIHRSNVFKSKGADKRKKSTNYRVAGENPPAGDNERRTVGCYKL